jgi:DNA-binding CsgD family transcriptional regulator
MERIKMRELYPKPTGGLTGRQIEVLRLVCNGLTGDEIAATLQLSIRRVNNIKTEMYTELNVRNENEAIRAALCQGIITVDELNFYPDKYDLKPLPEKREKGKVNRDKKGEKFL